jgi:hypothetical protein
MGRRILVIGSQCKQMQPLSFLPELARQFYAVMTDPHLGQCTAALPQEEGGGLLLDPTHQRVREAIRRAFRLAAHGYDTLILSYIGHGERSHAGRLYLMPCDADFPLKPTTAVDVIRLIEDLLEEFGGVDGLVLLLDACASGVAVGDAAVNLVRPFGDRLRMELLTATDSDAAYNGCFTRTLVQVIRDGLPRTLGNYVLSRHFSGPVLRDCNQRARRIEVEGGGDTEDVDPGLWISFNTGWSERTTPWRRTGIAEEIARLTAWYQPPPQLAEIVRRIEAERCLALTGPAGCGKSALAAALVNSEVTAGMVPDTFAQALAFLTPSTYPAELAANLATQLETNLDAFGPLRQSFKQRTPEEAWRKLSALEREVIGPLRLYADGYRACLVLDGLDQAPEVLAGSLTTLIDGVRNDPALVNVRLVVTSRPDTRLVAGLPSLRVDAAMDEQLTGYFGQRGLPGQVVAAAVGRADGNWLVARLLGDLYGADREHFDPEALPAGLDAIYERALVLAGAGDTQRWRARLRPVLGVLAAAGPGPVLPFELLRVASEALGGPSSPTRLRDVLVDLRGFVVRTDPGTPGEHVGLFHPTLADYLVDTGQSFAIDLREADEAMLEAIRRVAPAEDFDARAVTAAQRYAAMHEAEHLWRVGRVGDVVSSPLSRLASWLFPSWRVGRAGEVVSSLAARNLLIPAENLARWRKWEERLTSSLGPDHPDTLRTRSNIAYYTGEAGDARKALGLFEALLPDMTRVRGPAHPDTLATRNNIASWTGRAGDVRKALELSEGLLPDQERVLGPAHPDTLLTRNNIAYYTGEAGDARKALELSEALLPDQERVLGPDHPDTLTTRNNIAYSKGKVGDSHKALELLEALLPDMIRVLGPEHPDTLATRNNIADWTGAVGDGRKALELFKGLLPDQVHVLGPDHPDTLRTRKHIAHWTGETGDGSKALTLFQELLPDCQRRLGPEHPLTRAVRQNIEYLSGQSQP